MFAAILKKLSIQGVNKVNYGIITAASFWNSSNGKTFIFFFFHKHYAEIPVLLQLLIYSIIRQHVPLPTTQKCISGPSCSKLTTSLVNILLKFQM